MQVHQEAGNMNSELYHVVMNCVCLRYAHFWIQSAIKLIHSDLSLSYLRYTSALDAGLSIFVVALQRLLDSVYCLHMSTDAFLEVMCNVRKFNIEGHNSTYDDK